MEQSIELRVRRVGRDKYDLVLLTSEDVSVDHGVTLAYAVNWVKAKMGSRLLKLGVGNSVNFKSTVKFW